MTNLKENVRAVESRWAKTVTRLQKKLVRLREEKPAAKLRDFDALNLSASRERTISTGQDEDPMLTGKIRTRKLNFHPANAMLLQISAILFEKSLLSSNLLRTGSRVARGRLLRRRTSASRSKSGSQR